MHKEVWRYGASKAILRIDVDAIAQVEVVGLVSAREVAYLRSDLFSNRHIGDARALVLDFRRASVTFGLADLPLPVIEPPLHYAPIPVALVVNPHDEDLSIAHAWHQAKQGLVRATFTDAAAALSWAVERAEGTSAWG